MRHFLTLDVDWAPLAAVAQVVDSLVSRGLPATWFITDDGPSLACIRQAPRQELGLHPNFLPGSSHGAEPEAVMQRLWAWAPEAVAVRAHCVHHNGALLDGWAADGRLLVESNTYLPGHPGLQPSLYRIPEGRLWRIPFVWADDHVLRSQGMTGLEDLPMAGQPGWSVLAFHPIHLALNAKNGDAYARFRSHMVGRSFADATEADLLACREEGPGLWTAWLRWLDLLSCRPTMALAEAVAVELEGRRAIA